MALYNTVPAEDLRQESPKSIKKIVVVSAVTSFVLGACAATALSYREVGASRAGEQPAIVWPLCYWIAYSGPWLA